MSSATSAIENCCPSFELNCCGFENFEGNCTESPRYRKRPGRNPLSEWCYVPGLCAEIRKPAFELATLHSHRRAALCSTPWLAQSLVIGAYRLSVTNKNAS